MDKNSEEDLKKRQEQLDIEKLMSSDNGRRFVWKLLTYCGIYQDISFEEPYSAAKQAGKRQVGLYLLGILSEKQEVNVFKMMREARNASMEQETQYATSRRTEDDRSDSGNDEPTLDNGLPEYPFGLPKGGDIFDNGPDLDSFI